MRQVGTMWCERWYDGMKLRDRSRRAFKSTQEEYPTTSRNILTLSKQHQLLRHSNIWLNACLPISTPTGSSHTFHIHFVIVLNSLHYVPWIRTRRFSWHTLMWKVPSMLCSCLAASPYTPQFVCSTKNREKINHPLIHLLRLLISQIFYPLSISCVCLGIKTNH